MADPLVVRIVREHKQALIGREDAQMQSMALRWLKIEEALQGRIVAVVRKVAEIRATGQEVPEWRLWELKHFNELMGQASVEIEKYIGYADGLITGEQRELARWGLLTADEALKANEIVATFDNLPVDQIEAMVGSTGAGTPLRGLLDGAWPAASEGMIHNLVEATALGINPRDTARAMVNGMSGGLGRAMVIARTEQIRVYRTASLMGYRASGVVEGFLRMAAHDLRTCLGCLAAEGRFYPLTKPLDDHPQGRCSMIPKLFNRAAVEFTTGEEWVRNLPEADQIEILGEQRREMWRSGRVPFSQFAKTVENLTWGNSVVTTPLRELTPQNRLLTWLRR
jgi:hypothetical protein